MRLEIHDNEVGNTHAATVRNIDYAYQAEQRVQDLTKDEVKFQAKGQPFVIERFILFDDAGMELATWAYKEGKTKLISRSPDFEGEWELNMEFDGHERH